VYNVYRPRKVTKWFHLEHKEIVARGRAIWLGIWNYYGACTNATRLSYIRFIIYYSVALTLASKFKTHLNTLKKVFLAYGPRLQVDKADHKDRGFVGRGPLVRRK
jgi:hypothetical protein